MDGIGMLRFLDFFRFGISMQDLDFTAFCQARCLVIEEHNVSMSSWS